jgi:hypothetical protein
MRQRIRRHSLAEHFDVDIRTIDAWSKKGVLPRPHYLTGSPIPYWYTDETVDRPVAKQSEKTT